MKASVDVISELDNAAHMAMVMWTRRAQSRIPGESVMTAPYIEAFIVHPAAWAEYRRQFLMRCTGEPPTEITLLGKRVLTDYELSNFEVQIAVRP